jgi:hypothetical protein
MSKAFLQELHTGHYFKDGVEGLLPNVGCHNVKRLLFLSLAFGNLSTLNESRSQVLSQSPTIGHGWQRVVRLSEFVTRKLRKFGRFWLCITQKTNAESGSADATLETGQTIT